jgi:3-deoxy-manno-octulosonate cytidylyltransferase (CMP-KDO synthetase)
MSAQDSSQIVAVIPARYDSSRFPGKPLASIAGRPMIQHVFDRVRQCRSITCVVVATDDERIFKAVEAFGGEAVMTRPEHRCGTERVAEVAAHITAGIYVNVQGDEPLIDPQAVDSAVEALASDPGVNLATLSVAIVRPADIMDPNVVKVVNDFQGDALYFSRAPVPWVREESERVSAQHWKHIGVYVFRREALLDYPTLPPGELERLEQLEQLRWLENGYRIRVVESTYDAVSVDLPADVARVEALIRERVFAQAQAGPATGKN